MNDQELIPEQQLATLLELEAEKVEETLDLWKLIEKQVTASQNANLPAPDDFQNIDTVPDSLETSRKILTFPRMLKYALGAAAVLAIAFIIGTAIQPGKNGEEKDLNADIGPSKPPATIPGTIAIVPAATPSVRMLSASLKATLTGASDDVRAVAWKQDGTQIAAGSNDGVVNVWDANGKFLSRNAPSATSTKPGFPYNVAWPENGDTLASPVLIEATNLFPGPNGYHSVKKVGDTSLQVTNSDGSLLANISIPSGSIDQIVWSPDGKYIAAGGQSQMPASSGDIRVWVWKTDGTLVATIDSYNYPINSLVWSPDGKELAISAKGNNQAGVWSPDGTQIADLKGDFVIWDLAWSPDGQNLAAAGSDKLVRIYWNIGWGGDEYKLSLAGHQDVVWAVAWSPDGRTLASASADKTVRLWTVK